MGLGAMMCCLCEALLMSKWEAQGTWGYPAYHITVKCSLDNSDFKSVWCVLAYHLLQVFDLIQIKNLCIILDITEFFPDTCGLDVRKKKNVRDLCGGGFFLRKVNDCDTVLW